MRCRGGTQRREWCQSPGAAPGRHSGDGIHAGDAVRHEESVEAVEICIQVMGSGLVVVHVFREEAVGEFPLLLRGVELVLESAHLPQVVDAEHPLAELPGHPGNGGVAWMEFRRGTLLVPGPELGLHVPQLVIRQGAVQVGKGDLGSVLVRLLVVCLNSRPSVAETGCLMGGRVPRVAAWLPRHPQPLRPRRGSGSWHLAHRISSAMGSSVRAPGQRDSGSHGVTDQVNSELNAGGD